METKICKIVFLIILACIFLTYSLVNLQAEEECLKAAWNAFEKKDYEKAIAFADTCIDKFKKAAERTQTKLEKDKVPEPPTGEVSDAEKNKIFKRGLLNDVATAYFIKGRSAEYLYRKGGVKASKYKKMAEESYKAACKLKHGRTWDPKGWFWSPCEAASDRLPLESEK